MSSKMSSKNRSEIREIAEGVIDEVIEACENWPPMNSAHEGYGVLMEEIDELWDEIKIKQKNRDLAKMRKEAIQVAAMAMRFAFEVCNEETGRK
jgi:hypothetical protein